MSFHDLPMERSVATVSMETSSLFFLPRRTPLALLASMPSLVLWTMISLSYSAMAPMSCICILPIGFDGSISPWSRQMSLTP